MGRRLTRKKLKQVEFVSVVDEALHWFNLNWRLLAFGAAALVAIGLLWWGFSIFSASRGEKASFALHQATAVLEGEEADLVAAEAQLREIVDRYGRTAQGDVARLYLARILLDREENDEARALLA